MKDVLNKITRQPVLLTGAVTSGLGLLVLFGVDLTKDQIGGVVLFLGAVMALLTAVTTPSSEVAVQVVDGEVKAGKAAIEPTGTNVAQPPKEFAPDSAPVIASVAVKPELLE